MEAAPLGEQLVAASDINDVLSSSHMSVYDLIDELQKFQFIGPEVWVPLNELTRVLNVPIEQVTESVFVRLSEDLARESEKHQSMTTTLLKLLNLLRPFIHNSNFWKIFDGIVSNVETLPDWFLGELTELPISTILDAFPSPAARRKLFLPCRPLFLKAVYQEIEKFCMNPMNLDMLLNTIQCSAMRDVPKPGVGIGRYEYRVNLPQKADTLSKYHHEEVCKSACTALMGYCCGHSGLYNSLCCILRDLWERTGNPLLSALRLELAYSSSRLAPTLGDGLSRFADAVFGLIDGCQNRKLTPKEDLMKVTPDTVFASADPMLRLVCFAHILRDISIRLSQGRYEPYHERRDQKVLLSLLYPGVSDEILEDTANNIEALYLALELGRNPEPIIGYIKECCQSANVVTLVLFVGQHILDGRGDPRLLEAVLAPGEEFDEEAENVSRIIDEIERSGSDDDDTKEELVYLRTILRTGNTPPEIGIAFVMSQYLSLRGVTGEHSSLLTALLVRWAKKDRNVFLYVLALMKHCAVDESSIVAKWLDIMYRLGYFVELSSVEKGLVDRILSTPALSAVKLYP